MDQKSLLLFQTLSLFKEKSLLKFRQIIFFSLEIAAQLKFDRKHYQYCDLPFGYQITQFFHPICSDGYITLTSGKKINIDRIHMECSGN